MEDLNKKFDRLVKVIEDPDFLEGKGLSNEVNIRMFTYNPQNEMQVRSFVENLKARKDLSCKIVEINLYEIFLAICQDKNLLSRIEKMEEKKGSDFLLKNILRFSTTSNFSQKITYDNPSDKEVLLITGVGQVFPFMRVHSLLEELQVKFDKMPIVVMYPGEYNGTEMKLFNLLKPNGYYRAFNII